MTVYVCVIARSVVPCDAIAKAKRSNLKNLGSFVKILLLFTEMLDHLNEIWEGYKED